MLGIHVKVSAVTPQTDWQRVAAAVRERRIALGLTQAEAVARSNGLVSVPVWSLIENGRQTSYKPRTVAGVCSALGWTPDSIDRILAGGQPELATPPASSLDGGVEPPWVARLESKLVTLQESATTTLRALTALSNLRGRVEPTQVEPRPKDPSGPHPRPRSQHSPNTR